MDFQIQKNSELPVYGQLKEHLKQAILAGDFAEGKLPSIREFAKIAGVSLRTMDRAISGLLEEGICHTRSRIGVYVNKRISCGGRKRILYLASSYYKDVNMEYGSQLIGLFKTELYPDCQVEMKYYSLFHSYSDFLEYDLKQIQMQRPDVLIVCMELNRTSVKKMLNLPFPVFFIGDFKFGEMCEPGLNMIREDTVERGEILVKTACVRGCRDIVVVGGDEKKHFYMALLKKGISMQARKYGARIRFISGDDVIDSDMGALAEESIFHNVELRLFLEGGVPDAIIVDGFYKNMDSFIRVLRRKGCDTNNILFISTGNCIKGGILLHRDYSDFAKIASEEIRKAFCGKECFSGNHTLSGKIRYRELIYSNQQQEDLL